MTEGKSKLSDPKAFTLAEVLITLGIIGVVAALTMPSLMANYQKNVLKNQFKKTYSMLSQAIVKAQYDLGYVPDCYFFDTGASMAHQCVQWSSDGYCTKYETMDGNPIPPDINGPLTECSVIENSILKNLKVVKTCNKNSLANGCIPSYKGVDTIRREENEDISDADMNRGGCGYLFKNSLDRSLGSYVLADGSVLLKTHGGGYAVDINGKKGPNKWGYDVFVIDLMGNKSKPIYLGAWQCYSSVEKGGLDTMTMIRSMGD